MLCGLRREDPPSPRPPRRARRNPTDRPGRPPRGCPGATGDRPRASAPVRLARVSSSRAPGARVGAGAADTVVPTPRGLELPPGADEIVVRRSTRRRRSVAARLDGRRIVVMIPALMGEADQDRWVREMVRRLAGREGRRAEIGRAHV